MDLSLEHCGSEEHLKVERMCIITMVFWDKFSGNDSFLKKQVITVGNSKYLRTLRKRGSWKQKLVIACNQFVLVYLLWFRHIKWLLSLRGESSLLLNLDLRALALAERSVKQLYDRTRHDCIYLSSFHVWRQRAQLPTFSVWLGDWSKTRSTCKGRLVLSMKLGQAARCLPCHNKPCPMFVFGQKGYQCYCVCTKLKAVL